MIEDNDKYGNKNVRCTVRERKTDCERCHLYVVNAASTAEDHLQDGSGYSQVPVHLHTHLPQLQVISPLCGQ